MPTQAPPSFNTQTPPVSLPAPHRHSSYPSSSSSDYSDSFGARPLLRSGSAARKLGGRAGLAAWARADRAKTKMILALALGFGTRLSRLGWGTEGLAAALEGLAGRPISLDRFHFASSYQPYFQTSLLYPSLQELVIWYRLSGPISRVC